MKTDPFVSVVMLNQNGARFISEAIESALLQTYRRWEMIVVENGSTDHSWEVIQAWKKREPRIHAIRLTRGISIPAGRNVALDRAQGAYVATLDSDDVWLPERLARQVEFMECAENGKVGVCGANCWLIDAEGKRIGKKEFPATHEQCLRAFWYRNPFCHSATLIRRCCFDRLGHYDERFDVAQDLELWFRIGRTFKFTNLSAYLVNYRLWGHNVTIRRHHAMIQATVRARRLAAKQYGYRMGPAALGGLYLTWLMQWLPPRFVHWIFPWHFRKRSLPSSRDTDGVENGIPAARVTFNA